MRDWALKIPAGNGKIATIGFCWGGGRSFAYAGGAAGARRRGRLLRHLARGRGCSRRSRRRSSGFYGGDDARVDATDPPAEAEMKKLGKTYETHIYEGAGHGFLRDQAGRDGANLKATAKPGRGRSRS